MKKIVFKNGSAPALNDTTLNGLQSNIEDEFNSLKDVTLFENLAGTTENITLNGKKSTYNFLKVIGFVKYNDSNIVNFTKIIDKSESRTGLNIMCYQGASLSYYMNEILTLNDNSIVRGNQKLIGIGTTTTRVDGNVYITKVLGGA